MRIEDIEIHIGDPERPFDEVGPVRAQVGAATVFSSAPTMDEVNQRLREEVARMGANAVIRVQYQRGASLTSWKALTVTGVAVRLK